MKRRIPFLGLLVCFLTGIALGYFWRNYVAGILLGLGVGIIVMVVMRFILPKKVSLKEVSSDKKESD